MSINPDFLFSLEMRLLVFELAVIGLWIVLPRFPVRTLTAVAVSILVIAGSLRPDSYNTDTRNYASYVASLSIERGANIYFLTKLEPLHIFLIDLTRDFKTWLIVESCIALALIWILYFRVKRTESLLLVYAFFATLYTSSMRFAIALIVLAALLTWKKRSPLRLAAMSLIAGCIHAVMLVAGPFASRLKWMPLAFPGAFFAFVLLSPETRNRVASDLSDVKTVGLKSFATFLAVAAYCWYKNPDYRKDRGIWDAVGFTAIFLITALFFPFLNRIIIIGVLFVMMELDRYYNSLRKDNVIDRIFTLTVFAMITVPYILLTPDLYQSGRW